MATGLWQIVFIFLGKKLPKYAQANLERCRLDFPSHRIILGTDLDDLPENLDVEVVRVSSGLLSQELYSGFRDGFWIKSIERLALLERVHAQYPDIPLLHVEADVRLAPYFDFSILPTRELGWGQVTPIEDGAALVSSPNYSQSLWLSEELQKQVALRPGITDMPALFNIRTANPRRVRLLPTSHTGNPSERKKIFDFAAIGMWIAGTDPRNDAGISRIRVIQPGHQLNLDENDIRLDVGEGQLLLLNSQGGVGQVQNVHLHAKQPLLFSLEWKELIRHLNKFDKDWKFYPRSFMLWIRDRAGEYRGLVMGTLKKLSSQK